MMKEGDLCRVIMPPSARIHSSEKLAGYGLYLGMYRTHYREPPELLFWWRGRVTTFDPRYWRFEVVR